MRCDGVGHTITLARTASAVGQVPVSILAQDMSRTLTGTAKDGAVSVVLTARDPLLDAMAFSRGRFAVEVAGQPSLYVPSWTEVSRVIEDCR